MGISTNRKHARKSLLALIVVLLAMAVGAGQGGVVELYKKAGAPILDEAYLELEPVLPVDTVLVATKHQGVRFWTDSRKTRIQRYRCSRCHNNEAVTIARAAEVSHGDIRLDHGGEDKPLDCFTCHKRDERDYLVTERGSKIDMDHSYQMCGQCHFRQNRDWVGGAHGKRFGYWTGKRVVRNCASCHDPHSPRFDKRWPVTYSPPSTY